jgi:serine/threonine protein kinase
VVHRDIKPQNFFFSRGHALVADFGVARALQAVGSNQLTQTGMSGGTPAYISPEQRLADPIIDERSDLYSLGCVPNEMLALLRQHRDWAIGVGPRTDLAAKPIIGVTVRPLTSRQ